MPQKGLVNKEDILRIMASIYAAVNDINIAKQREAIAYNKKISDFNSQLKTLESSLNQQEMQLSVLEKRQYKPIILTVS